MSERGVEGKDWNRSLFTVHYDFSRPPNNWAFLGNGSMMAFFDGTGIDVCDYVVCKGIRRSGNMAGLFWTYTYPSPHRHIWQRVTLDMYEGLFQTEELCDRWQAWRQVTTFIHLRENLLVFHLNQHEAEVDPKMVGLSTRSRGGYPARKGTVNRRERERMVILDFPITGDIAPDPRLYGGGGEPFYQEIALRASIAVGIEGEGRFIEADDGNIEVVIPRSGVMTIYVGFDALREGTPGAEEIVRQSLEKGYDMVQRDHASEWAAFWADSRMDLPHEELTKVYVASLYYLRTCAGRYSAAPAQLLMDAWGSAYNPWDDTHIHHAFLTSNQVALAEGMVEHWASFRELGGEAMRLRGASGIHLDRFAFEPEYYRTPPRPLSRDDFNGSLGAGLSAWRQYTHTGRRQVLEKYYGFIRGLAEMLATYAFVPHGDRFWLRKARQIDDHFGEEGQENAFGPAVMGKALLTDAAMACEEMGDQEMALSFRKAAERVELPMREGVYITFPGCPMEAFSNESILNFFPAAIIPDPEVAERTLDYYEKTCMGTHGLECFPTWTVNRAVFPWVHFRAMIGEIMLGRREQFERLLGQVLAHGCYASDFRMLPQYINRRGGWHDLPGFLTGTGAFLQMVNMMLLYGDGQSVRVFQTVPEGWLEERIAFRLRTVPGVLVDLCTVPGQGMELRIESTRPVEILVRKPAFAKRALMDGGELEEQGGFIRFEAPAGSSRVQIVWQLR